MSYGDLFDTNYYKLSCERLVVANTETSVLSSLIVVGGASISGDMELSGTVKYSDSTPSTSSTSGALVCAGGIGVSEDSFFGKDVTIGGTLTCSDLVYEQSEIITSSDDSISTSTGASVVVGGMGIGRSLFIGGDVTMLGTSQSVDTSTGALTVAGGVGIKNDLRVGGIIYGTINGTTTTTTDDSTSTSSGSLIVNGGVGIAKRLNVGGKTDVPTLNVSSFVVSSDTSTGSIIVAGGIGVGNNVNMGGNLSVLGASSLKSCTVSSSLVATSNSTGAVVVTGGIYVGNNIMAGNSGSVISTPRLDIWLTIPSNAANITYDSSALLLNNITQLKTPSIRLFSWKTVGSSFTANITLSNDDGNITISMANATNNKLIVNAGTDTKRLYVSDSTASISTSTGAIRVVGGVGVGGSISATDLTLYNGAGSSAITVNPADSFLTLSDTRVSTVLNTKSLTFFYPATLYEGDIALNGTNGNLKIISPAAGIEMNIQDAVTVSNKLVVSGSETASTSTGALSITGGAHILDNLFVNNSARASDFTTPTVTSLNTFYTSVKNVTDTLISVKNYGALGNNVNDDTIPFQNWWTAISQPTAIGIGYIPAGTYKITGSLTWDCSAIVGRGLRIAGDGMNASILQFDSGCTLTISSATAVYYLTMYDFGINCFVNGYGMLFSVMIRDSELSRIRITNSNGATGCGGVSFTYLVGCHLNNLICQGNNTTSTNAGIHIASASNAIANAGYISSFGIGLNLVGAVGGCSFISPDIEYCARAVKLNSASISNNLFIGGTFYSSSVCFVDSVLTGGNNVMYYPAFGASTKYGGTNGFCCYGSTGTAIGSLNSLPPDVYASNLYLGTSTNALSNYSVVNTTLTWSRSLTNTFVVRCCKVGANVTISSDKYTGTSSGTSTYLLSTTGITSTYWPLADIYCPIWTLNNTANICGLLIIAAGTGIITIYRDISNLGTNFQNNTTIGYSFSVSYNV